MGASLLALAKSVYYLLSVRTAYRALRVEGRVLVCLSKPQGNKRLQKDM